MPSGEVETPQQPSLRVLNFGRITKDLCTNQVGDVPLDVVDFENNLEFWEMPLLWRMRM